MESKLFFLALVLVLILFGLSIAMVFLPYAKTSGFIPLDSVTDSGTITPQTPKNTDYGITVQTSSLENLGYFQSDVVNPADFPVREEFFKEIYRPKRETYKLLEKAAAFLHTDTEGAKKYFGLKNEQEIFSNLPPVPKDFSETALFLASGKFFGMSGLGPEYYTQPELYPNFKNNGLKYWTKPDPEKRAQFLYGAYPTEQSDALETNGRDYFFVAFFVHSAWGSQNFQGVSLEADPEAAKYFDVVEITPKDFLLGPVWPKFSNQWAQKITIKGKTKPNTPPGTYKLAINIIPPPEKQKKQWELEHKNLYADAADAAIGRKNVITANISVAG